MRGGKKSPNIQENQTAFLNEPNVYSTPAQSQVHEENNDIFFWQQIME